MTATKVQSKIIEVPVSTYVRRILEKDSQTDEDGCIRIYENSLPGQSLVQVVAELPFPAIKRPPRETIRLKVSERLFHRYYQWSGDELYRLGAFYERVAQRIMCAWLDAGKAMGFTQVGAAQKLYEHYGIDEWDYPRDNLIQLYKTHRTDE
jgi:hypothetical protein